MEFINAWWIGVNEIHPLCINEFSGHCWPWISRKITQIGFAWANKSQIIRVSGLRKPRKSIAKSWIAKCKNTSQNHWGNEMQINEIPWKWPELNDICAGKHKPNQMCFLISKALGIHCKTFVSRGTWHWQNYWHLRGKTNTRSPVFRDFGNPWKPPAKPSISNCKRKHIRTIGNPSPN